MNQSFASGGQSIGVSASASALPMNIQDWSPLGLTGWISLQSKGLSRVFSQNHSSKISILLHSAFFMVQFSHPYMTTGKTIALTTQTFVGKVMSLLFNMLSRLSYYLTANAFPNLQNYKKPQLLEFFNFHHGTHFWFSFHLDLFLSLISLSLGYI